MALCDVTRQGPIEILAVQDTLAVFDTSDPTAQLLKPVPLARITASRQPSAFVYSVAIAPDCSLVASAADDTKIRLWDLCTGNCVAILHGHTSRVACVTFSEDSQHVLSGGGGGPRDSTVRLFSVVTNRQVSDAMRGHQGDVNCVAFVDKEEQRSQQQQQRHFDRDEEGGEEQQEQEQQQSPSSSSITDLIVASGSADCTIRIWNGSTAVQIATLSGHTGSVTGLCCCYSSSNDATLLLLVSGSQDETLRFWKRTEDKSVARWEQRGESISVGAAINSVSMASPQHKLIAVSCLDETGTVLQFDAETRKKARAVISSADFMAWTACHSPDGAILVCGCPDSTIRFFDSTSGAVLTRDPLKGSNSTIYKVAFAADNRTLVAATGNTIVIYRICRGAQIKAVRFPSLIAAVRISDDSSSFQTIDELGIKRTFPLPLPALLGDKVVTTEAEMRRKQQQEQQEQLDSPCKNCEEERQKTNLAEWRVSELETEVEQLKAELEAARAEIAEMKLRLRQPSDAAKPASTDVVVADDVAAAAANDDAKIENDIDFEPQQQEQQQQQQVHELDEEEPEAGERPQASPFA